MPLKTLILFAHPLFEKSRTHRHLLHYIKKLPDVTIRDLYQEYPDFYIHIDVEQHLVERHDIIIFQHPIYWYSVPSLLKQWMEQVLQIGWAYGRGGSALRGKLFMQILSTGSIEQAYSAEGQHRYPLRSFLLPYEQTAQICGMKYLAPFVVHGTHRLSENEIDDYGRQCFFLLDKLMNEGNFSEVLSNLRYANDWFKRLEV